MMRINNIGGRNGQDGVALLYAIFGTFVAAGMASVMFTMAGVTQRRSQTERAMVEAEYLADGAAEAAKKVLVEAIANWETPPTEGEVDIDGMVVPWALANTGFTRIVTDGAGIQTIVDSYEIETLATVNGKTAQSHRIVNAESTPVFQFAVFYTSDLEIQPGPNMTLGGRVHSNGDMYLGCGKTLTLDTNYVRAIGDIYRRRKNNTQSNGNIDIRQYVANPYDSGEPVSFVRMNSEGQMDSLGVTNTSGYDSAFVDGWDADGDGYFTGPDDWLPFSAGALDLWDEPDGYGTEGYTVMTGDHGVSEAATPNIGSIAMYDESEGGGFSYDPDTNSFYEVGPGLGDYAPGFYHASAGLAIIVNAEGTSWTATDDMGVDVTAVLAASGAVSLTTVPDMRQSDSEPIDVTVAQIDIALLGGTGYYPDNGLVYVAHNGMGEGTEASGVMIVNGFELNDTTNDAPGLPTSDALTIVTEGSAYVQGDFNTVDKVGSAIIADAVNLLSNSWDNSKTPGSLPVASETTFNCAMITGNYETVDGEYNGGLENLPRFHEKWSSIDCNISGSFVNTWESQYATAEWKYGSDRYKAPRRAWEYDEDFNSIANLPPFTPMAVTAKDIVSW
jgi:hypothetical protein